MTEEKKLISDDPKELVQTAEPAIVPPKEEGKGEIVLDIEQREAEDGKNVISFNLGEAFEKINQWVIDHSPIGFEERLLFFQLMTTMVDAGVSIPESLRLLYQQVENPAFKKVIANLEKKMNAGESFADSLGYYPKLFDDATCSIVRAGESSGKLTEILRELVKQFERMNQINKKAKGVMTYPVVVISVMILLLVVVMVVVVPKLEAIFGGGENLPLPTRIMIGMSDFFINQWYFLLGGTIAVVTSFILWKNSLNGKRQLALIIIKIPVIKVFVQQLILSRVTRIMSFLIQSGVSIIESLKISADIAGNELYRRKMLLAAEDLGKGIEMSENFADDEALFPSMMVRMIAIGERTSSLGKILGKLADYYDEELERRVGTISKLMEPLIIVMMAVGAVFMILAIYLPILQMNDKVAG